MKCNRALAALLLFSSLRSIPEPCNVILGAYRFCPDVDAEAPPPSPHQLPQRQRFDVNTKAPTRHAPSQQMYWDLSPRLVLLAKEAREEIGLLARDDDMDHHAFSLYPRRYWQAVDGMLRSPNHTKTHDFCFIGSIEIDAATRENRAWILPFIDAHFTPGSLLQFSDAQFKKPDPWGRQNYRPRGPFDRTLEGVNFVPKTVPKGDRGFFDAAFFGAMARCRLCLAPAGDSMWSMRFVEALMCRCLPVVRAREESFRSRAEERVPYKFLLSNQSRFEYREDWAEHNYQLFKRFHTLQP